MIKDKPPRLSLPKPNKNIYTEYFGNYSDNGTIRYCYKVWKNGKCTVVDPSGSDLCGREFADLHYFISRDGLISFCDKEIVSVGYDSDEEDCKRYGIFSIPEKKVLFEPQFIRVVYDVDAENNILAYVWDKTLGRHARIIDRNGKDKFPSEYSCIHTWPKAGPWEVYISERVGDKWRARHGLIDTDGNVLVSCKYYNTTWGELPRRYAEGTLTED